MSGQDFPEFVKQGITATERGNTMDALRLFETASRLGSSPILKSYMGYCLVRERQQLKEAIRLCHQALTMEPEQAVHYFNPGRVFLAAANKELAITAFRRGLRWDRHRLIRGELKKLGNRRPLTLPFLSRRNPANKYLGLVLTHLHLR